MSKSKKAAVTQFPLTKETSLGSSIEEQRENYKAKYGFSSLTDSEIKRIELAEAEIAECEGCTGESCQKQFPDYYKAQIKNVSDTLQIELEHCQYYQTPPKPKPTKVMPTDFQVRLGNFDVKEFRRQYKARKERERPRILAQYGLAEADDATIGEILDAEEKNALCNNCKGESCQKVTEQYEKRLIKIDGHSVQIEKVKCAVGMTKSLQEKCRQCFIPQKYVSKTFADYEVTSDNVRAVKMAHWFIEEKPSKSLYIYGQCGTGKTFLAAIIAQEWLKSFKTVTFGDVPALLDEIKRTFDKGNDQTTEKVFDRYCECDLLILDDLGAGQVTEWNIGQIYQIINSRYNADKATIVTSNFSLQGLESRLASKDKYSATRITSRLSEMCVQAFLGTTDRRGQSC